MKTTTQEKNNETQNELKKKQQNYKKNIRNSNEGKIQFNRVKRKTNSL